MKSWVREYRWQITVTILVMAVLCTFVARKEGYHMDEVLSFEFANAEYTPWLVPWQPEGRFATFVYNEIETGDFAETAGNWMRYTWDYWVNGEESFAYNYPGKVYVQSVWISREEMKELVTTGEDDQFNLISVYYNNIRDSHPPLFYIAFHIVSSIFAGVMSPWIGGIVNISAFLVTSIFLIKISLLLTGNKRAGTLAVLLYGLSAGGIATVVLIRMYCMLTMFCVVNLYVHLKKWQSGNYRTQNGWLIAMTCCGFWTQYFYVFYAAFLALVTVIGLLLLKQGRQAFYYVRSMIIAAAIGLACFPYAITDVIGGGMGGAVLDGLFGSLAEFAERLGIFGSIVCSNISGKHIGMVLLIILAGYVLVQNLLHKRKAELPKQEVWSIRIPYLLVVIPMIGFFLIAAKVSPYYADRYIMPVFVILALILALLLDRYCRKTSLAVILTLALGGISIANYGGTYLYSGYENQLEVAKEYAEYPCLCLYDGATFYENIPEFLIYEQTLMLSQGELENRVQHDLLVDREDVVLLIKRNVDEVWLHDMMKAKYGYDHYEQIYQDTIYGEKLFFYTCTENAEVQK